MTYRNGTYVAFDGQGETNPTESDFKYYATLQAWAANDDIKFDFVNSHEKTYAVRDNSLAETLNARIRERLRNSKNMIVILSSETRASGSKLSYEVDIAVDLYKIPLIITYVDHCVIAEPSKLTNYWPNVLCKKINNNTAKAIHIPFAKGVILDAIKQFDVHSDKLKEPKHFYSEDAHRTWSLMPLLSDFRNMKKQSGIY